MSNFIKVLPENVANQIAAGEVIGHVGPRPNVSVKNLFIQSELISGFTGAVV